MSQTVILFDASHIPPPDEGHIGDVVEGADRDYTVALPDDAQTASQLGEELKPLIVAEGHTAHVVMVSNAHRETEPV